jgi:hypothetical protein
MIHRKPETECVPMRATAILTAIILCLAIPSLTAAQAHEKYEGWCITLEGASLPKLVHFLDEVIPHPTVDRCITWAIDKLGTKQYEPAIPALIKFLDFRAPKGPMDEIVHQNLAVEFFPAEEALQSVGKKALPDVLRAIESGSTSDLARETAVSVWMGIHRQSDEQPKAISLLKQEETKVSDDAVKKRLRWAAQKALTYCSSPEKPACQQAASPMVDNQSGVRSSCDLAKDSILSRSAAGVAQVSNIGDIHITCRVPARPFPSEPGQHRGILEPKTTIFEISEKNEPKSVPSEVNTFAGGFDSTIEWVEFYVHIPLDPDERDAEACRYLAKLRDSMSPEQREQFPKSGEEKALEGIRSLVYQHRLGHFRMNFQFSDGQHQLGGDTIEIETLFKGHFSDKGCPLCRQLRARLYFSY